jgi:hypothetical protein
MTRELPMAERAPISRRVVLIASAVLGLTLAAIVVDGRRVRTGELLIQSDRAELLVTLRRGGQLVQGPTGRRSFTLTPGDYEIGVDGRQAGRISIARGERSVFQVTDPIRNADSRP